MNEDDTLMNWNSQKKFTDEEFFINNNEVINKTLMKRI